MESAVVDLGEKQHGVITHAQVLGLGVRSDTIDNRLRHGRLVPLAEGVYRFPGAPRSWAQQLQALVLAAGPGAAASHRAAAALLGVPGFGPDRLEVSTSRPMRNRLSSIHSSRLLPDEHLTVVSGIVTTRLARTLFDLAAVAPPGRVERAVDNSLAAGKLTVAALADVVEYLGRRGRRGTALMRRIVEARGGGCDASATRLEARFLRLVEDAGLPKPVREHDIGDQTGWIGRVDVAYPAERLVVELDSRRWHDTKLAIEADQRRDQRLTAAGWRVVRVRWAQLTEHPEEVALLLRRLLGG